MYPPTIPASDGFLKSDTHDTQLVREVRSFCLSRAHLNPFAVGRSESLRRQKLAAIRALSYTDAIAAIRIARREGNRRGGIGPQMAAAMLNAIARDSVEPGEQIDVIAIPREPEPVEVMVAPTDAELAFARSQTRLHNTLVECVADQQLDEKEVGLLVRLHAREDRDFVNVIRAYGMRVERSE
jgi:hypothetical protein